MKKFFNIIPSTSVDGIIYKAYDNDDLKMDKPTCFPIIQVINAYAKKDEKIMIIALKNENMIIKRNCNIFEQEIEELSAKNGFAYEINYVDAGEDQHVKTQVENFQKLIEYTDDNDELFGCLTFGTKIQTLTLKMAITYSNKIKTNTFIDTIVYALHDWSTGKASIYDITALIQMEGIVDSLAKIKSSNPEKVIKNLISFV